MSEESKPSYPILKRQIGLLAVLLIGLGTVIGGDYFIVDPFIIAETGPSVYLAYAIAGIIMALVALCYSELMAMWPEAGGEFVYITRAFGTFVGWLVASVYWLAWLIVIGVNGIVIGDYMNMFFPWLPVPRWVWSELATIILGYVCYRGISLTSWVQGALAIGLVLAFLAYMGVGFAHFNPANLSPFFVGGWTGFWGAVAFATLFYVGFDCAPQLAEEMKLPKRKIALTALIIVFGVGILLVGTNAAAVVSAPYDDIVALTEKEWALPYLLKPWIGDLGVALITIPAGLLGALTTALGCYIVASRLMFAFARAGRLPKMFAHIHPKYSSPDYAALFVLAVGVIATWIRELLVWVAIDVIIMLFTYIMVALSLIMLRVKHPDYERPYKCPGYPVTPLLVIGLCGYLLYHFYNIAPLEAWLLVIGWAIIMTIIYFIYGKPKE